MDQIVNEYCLSSLYIVQRMLMNRVKCQSFIDDTRIGIHKVADYANVIRRLTVIPLIHEIVWEIL